MTRTKCKASELFFMGVVLSAGICFASELQNTLRPPRNGSVYVVAHRGAHQGIPENTLAAYKRAIELGVDFVEIDVRQTKDGHLVSVHNASVDAYVLDGKKGKVNELTLEELKALDIGSRIDPKWKDEKIPTLDEIFSLCKGKVGIYLDLKEAPVDRVVQLVKKYGMEHDVLWYADVNELKEVQAACASCIVMPDPGPVENLSKLIELFHPTVVAAVWEYFTPEMAMECQKQGAVLIVDEGHVSPPQDVECWEKLVEGGAGGIQTNYPEELIRFLRTRNQQR